MKRAALYLRLSREDAGIGVSESIQNQKDFLIEYCLKNQLEIGATYIDDGYSGTNYDRPAFKQMLSDIESGKIGTVLTKDLSRLGRDYILTGHYLERYFPEHGIRYIAVSDHIDTFHDGPGDDLAPFRAVFNDLYAKDISKKVRTSLTVKKHLGKFVGSTAPYGYMRDPDDKNHLLPDPVSKRYVKHIYEIFLKEGSIAKTLKILNTEAIPTPGQYKNGRGGEWNHNTVRRILTSPTYAGNLTQGRTKKAGYKANKILYLPQQEWITISSTHPPIVSQEMFNLAQELLDSKRYQRNSPYLFSGKLFCADCGRPMYPFRQGQRVYYVCSTWKRQSGCTSHCISESLINQAIKQDSSKRTIIKKIIICSDKQIIFS